MASVIETLKVYVIGIEFPACLNDPSPAKVIPLVGDWRTQDASQPRRNTARLHRRVGVILRYDPVTSIAVVFLGSSRPTQPHRYVPWLGTPRLPFQPRYILQPDGGGGDFRNFPGYLNFTHAIRVMVVQPGAVNIRNPGPATVHDLLDRELSPPDMVHIRLALCELETLKGLHASYWNDIRYTIDGTELDGGGGGGGGGVPGTSVHGASGRGAGVSTQGGGGGVTTHGRGGGGVTTHGGGGGGVTAHGGGGVTSHGGGGGGETSHGGDGGGVTSHGGGVTAHGGSSVTAQEDLAAFMSMKIGRALAWEHFRNQQISMMEGDGEEDEDTLDFESLPRCFLRPLTAKDFQCEVSSDESSIGFSWEMDLGVDTSVQIES